jgi:hypothetical protein
VAGECTSRDAALERLRGILTGIDQEDYYPEGWWETSHGAEFGAAKLAALEDLIVRLVPNSTRDPLT